ncbi:hypothetical protein [Corynebacterium striatum]|uniref:hypothetical protein n=1 Tax=Corynebacterium striatum TaxID=43770 RepID=UPI001EF42857|nr:hypothetical protein [Corynebacterium striatum]
MTVLLSFPAQLPHKKHSMPLTELAKDGTHPCALIFTENGAKNKRPLSIATPTDLAVLVDALEWE